MATQQLADIEKTVRSVLRRAKGTDNSGKEYRTLEDLWKYIYPNSTNVSTEGWYGRAFDYWEAEANCPLDDDGVLGGYGALTPQDSRGSNAFLDALSQQLPDLKCDVAADCGAGIGRVTKHFLQHRFKRVDLVEQSPRLLAGAPAYIGVEPTDPRIGYLRLGLQDFAPAPGSYDVIWIQWVIGHLHDLDCITFFQRCAAGLTPGGVIVLKDNTITDTAQLFCLDLDDHSVCRHAKYMRVLFDMAGLEVVRDTPQTDFPEELYPVHMIALRPKQTV